MRCEIIKDLLPSYLDDLCSEESKKAVEEHLEQCSACQNTLSGMRGEGIEVAREQGTEQERERKQVEQEDLAILRTMKKVVWRRVFGMVAGIVAAFIAVMLLISQMHPEWDFFNVEHFMMKQTAKNATEAFVEGNIGEFLAGIQKSAEINANYYDTQDEQKEVYDLTREQIQKLYETQLKGKEIKVAGYDCGMAYHSYHNYSDEETGWIFTVQTSLEYESQVVELCYSFWDRDKYAVNFILYEDGKDARDGLEKACQSIGDWCLYLQNSIFTAGPSSYAILTNVEKGQKREQGKATILQRVGMIFSEDCFGVNGMHYMSEYIDGEFPETIQRWGESYDTFLQNHMVEQVWFESEGIDESSHKEIRTMIWKFEDLQGNSGILLKKFFYGPGGYEPMDETEEIYGQNLQAATLEQLQALFT